jgi:hypothetical protein
MIKKGIFDLFGQKISLFWGPFLPLSDNPLKTDRTENAAPLGGVSPIGLADSMEQAIHLAWAHLSRWPAFNQLPVLEQQETVTRTDG